MPEHESLKMPFSLAFMKQAEKHRHSTSSQGVGIHCGRQTQSCLGVSKQYEFIARLWNQDPRTVQLCPTFSKIK